MTTGIERLELPDRVEYRLRGKLHRTDGPAIEYSSVLKEWYINGLRHREDGPAIERISGNKSWYLNGKLHREHGPAVEWANGNKSWWFKGHLHRLDGPAVEWAGGLTTNSIGWMVLHPNGRMDLRSGGLTVRKLSRIRLITFVANFYSRD
jgi:hypothetical protein